MAQPPNYPNRGTEKWTEDEYGRNIKVIADGRGGWSIPREFWVDQRQRALRDERKAVQWEDSLSIAVPEGMRASAARQYRRNIKAGLRRWYTSGHISSELRRHLDLRIDSTASEVAKGPPVRDPSGLVVEEDDGSGQDLLVQELRRRFRSAYPDLRVDLAVNEEGPRKGGVNHIEMRRRLSAIGRGWCHADCNPAFPHGHPTHIGRNQTPGDSRCKARRRQYDKARKAD
jgi:hypothetical protein